MAARPKQHSLLARRAFWGIVLSLLIVLGGLSALLYQAYLGFYIQLQDQPPTALWAGVQSVLAVLGADLAPYEAPLIGGVLLVLIILVLGCCFCRAGFRSRSIGWWRRSSRPVRLRRASCRSDPLARSARSPADR